MGDKQAGANTGKVMKRSSVVNDGKPLVNNEKAATIAAKEQNLLKGWKQKRDVFFTRHRQHFKYYLDNGITKQEPKLPWPQEEEEKAKLEEQVKTSVFTESSKPRRKSQRISESKQRRAGEDDRDEEDPRENEEEHEDSRVAHAEDDGDDGAGDEGGLDVENGPPLEEEDRASSRSSAA